jgi:hypothetical protein
MVTGGQALVDETRGIVEAFSGGPHIFNLGHGITPDADPENVHHFAKRRQAHQHGVRVMPGFQPELGAPVIDEVVFGIEPAMDQLRILVGLGPGLHPVRVFDQRHEGRQEGAADILGQREIGLPVAGVVSSMKMPPTPRARLRCGM